MDIEGFAKKGEVYTYQKHGFEATEYTLRTDQLGTQLDPPAHWAPGYPSIDELPATYATRPLVVISIVEQVRTDPNYALQVADIEAWEEKHGRIPEGSVVFVRSDWSKAWPDPKLALAQRDTRCEMKPRIDPVLRDLLGLSLLAAGGCGLALSQGDLVFVAIFGGACAVIAIETLRRLP